MCGINPKFILKLSKIFSKDFSPEVFMKIFEECHPEKQAEIS